jgi:uncharacterized protein YecE (DUF72 family)
MQNPLFPTDAPADPAPAPAAPTTRGPAVDTAAPKVPPAVAAGTPPRAAPKPSRSLQVQPAEHAADLHDLAARLSPALRLGTSSWSFPGWNGLVWGGAYSTAMLAKRGLAVYAQHPLLRTVSLDRAFYQPLTPAQYAAYAEQVPHDFRFVVKAPSVVADALVRGPDGRGLQANAGFLDPALAWSTFVEPALQGLQAKTGALVFQLSPLSPALRSRMPEQIQRLGAMLAALPPLATLREQAPDLVIAVEVRDAAWLVPAFVEVLRAAGATYCLGLHARMPPIDEQLPLLRALWPGPLVCRWSLHRDHGAHGYEEAKALYEPFDQLVDPDPATRAVLARVARATSAAGHAVYITINNKAEGSAPRTVEAMARLLVP